MVLLAPLQRRRHVGRTIEHIADIADRHGVEDAVHRLLRHTRTLVHPLHAVRWGHPWPSLPLCVSNACDMVWWKGPCSPLIDETTSRRLGHEIGIDRDDREPIQSQIARQIRALVLSGRLQAADEAALDPRPVGGAERRPRHGGGGLRAAPQRRLSRNPFRLRHQGRRRTPRSAADLGPQGEAGAGGTRRRPARTGEASAPASSTGKTCRMTTGGGLLPAASGDPPPGDTARHDDAFGWLPLREAIHGAYEWRGISCAADQVIVTAGGLDAFDLMGRAILQPGDEWFEEPGYPTARRICSLGGVAVCPVPSMPRVSSSPTADGGGGTRRLRHPGAAISDRRHHAARAASRTPRLGGRGQSRMHHRGRLRQRDRYVGRPLPALMSLETKGAVIYAGTFSKVFSPSSGWATSWCRSPLVPRFPAGAPVAWSTPFADGAAGLAEYVTRAPPSTSAACAASMPHAAAPSSRR